MSATPTVPNFQGVFAFDAAWSKLMQLLRGQLPGVDVQAVSEKDFSQSGDLIMNPPSARVFFAGAAAHSLSDAQKLSYDVEGRFIVMCCDQDLRGIEHQAIASAALATRVLVLLAGTRLDLNDGETSEPITWVSTEPIPVTGVGTAYGLGIEVPGLAQFPGPNAAGFGGFDGYA